MKKIMLVLAMVVFVFFGIACKRGKGGKSTTTTLQPTTTTVAATTTTVEATTTTAAQ